jgi:hypothetical protein
MIEITWVTMIVLLLLWLGLIPFIALMVRLTWAQGRFINGLAVMAELM